MEMAGPVFIQGASVFHFNDAVEVIAADIRAKRIALYLMRHQNVLKIGPVIYKRSKPEIRYKELFKTEGTVLQIPHGVDVIVHDKYMTVLQVFVQNVIVKRLIEIIGRIGKNKIGFQPAHQIRCHFGAGSVAAHQPVVSQPEQISGFYINPVPRLVLIWSLQDPMAPLCEDLTMLL